MMRMLVFRIFLPGLAVMSVFMAFNGPAGPNRTAAASNMMATVVFPDPIATQGDQISTAGDVSKVVLIFDITTGDYEVTVTADPTNPFNGDLRFNLNIGNLRIGPGQSNTSLFSVFNVSSATTLMYSGTSLILTTWQIGDAVTTFHITGLPGSFNSGLIDLDDIVVSNRDIVKTQSIIEEVNPVSVGGTTSFLTGSSGSSSGNVALLAAAVAAIVVIVAGAWYIRKRWLGSRS